VPARRAFSGFNSTLGLSATQNLVVLILDPQTLQRINTAINGYEIALRPTLTVRDQFVISAMLALEADVRDGNPLGPIYGETIAVALMTHLIRHYGEITGRHFDRPDLCAARARKIREYIDAHLGDRILLSDLASVMGLEVHHVAKAFKKNFGVPPHRYILNERIK